VATREGTHDVVPLLLLGLGEAPTPETDNLGGGEEVRGPTELKEWLFGCFFAVASSSGGGKLGDEAENGDDILLCVSSFFSLLVVQEKRSSNK